jgi:hypothetical protein
LSAAVGVKLAGGRADPDGSAPTRLSIQQDRFGATPELESVLVEAIRLDKPMQSESLGTVLQYLADRYGLVTTIDEVGYHQMFGPTNLIALPISLPPVPGESVEQFVRRVCRQVRGYMQIDDGRIYLTTLPKVRVSAGPAGETVRLRDALIRIERVLEISIDRSGVRAVEAREVPIPGPEAMPLAEFLEKLLRPAGCEFSFAGTASDVVVRLRNSGSSGQ